jgi:ribosomal protein L11 methyltransferase
LQATLDNARLNQVASVVQVSEPAALEAGNVDILIANILLEPLLSLRQQFVQMLRPGGSIVLSGLLADQRQELEAAYAEDFEFSACEQMQDWVRLTATRH